MMNAAFQNGFGEMPLGDSRKTIPFDYAFRFELTGQLDNVINSILTVSIEAAFIAVSMGYGVIPKVTPVIFGPKRVDNPNDPCYDRKPLGITLGEILDGLSESLSEESENFLKSQSGPEAVLINGLKLNPEVAEAALIDIIANEDKLEPGVQRNLFRAVGAPPGQIQFLYALFDEGTGREFQSEPILNTAGLGISNGDRPFRYFAKPVMFAPRTTIRMQVIEKSEFPGELHVSLNGYKVLGQAGTPTSIPQQQRSAIERSRRR